MAVRQVDFTTISERLQHAAIEDVAMAAVVGIGLDMLEFEKPGHGGAAMHDDAKLPGLFVQLHSEIGGLFVERVAPVSPAPADPFPLDGALEVAEKGVGEVLPEPLDGFRTAFRFQKLEQFAVGRDKFSAGDHRSSLQDSPPQRSEGEGRGGGEAGVDTFLYYSK